MAAARTVEPATAASTRCTPTSCARAIPTVPILYEVDRIRDGRSFTTRRVVAIQHGRAIFNLQASFHVPEEGFDHQAPDARRRARPPSSCPTSQQRWAPWAEALGDWYDAPPPHRQPRTSTGTPARSQPAAAALTSGCGCGPTARCPTTRCCTPASLTYASDMTLLDTTLLPHAVGAIEQNADHGQPRPRHVVPPAVPGRRVAALRPGHPLGVRRARGIARGSIFTHDGHLAVTVVQEGLLRIPS